MKTQANTPMHFRHCSKGGLVSTTRNATPELFCSGRLRLVQGMRVDPAFDMM